jgi:hypothetical protein
MLTPSDRASLPPEAETFLSRLPGLPEAPWRDIIERDRQPPLATLLTLVRGLKLTLLPPRFRRAFDAHYSEAAANRLRALAQGGALPMRLGWRLYQAAGSALQGLCSRSWLREDQFREMYAPFEPHIPFESLRPSDHAPSGSGLAGA